MRFSGFDLDEKQRALRLEGREVELQPRVFDLLVYLVRHRDRVVGKEELLEQLWPGTVVVDGALQRVVSLARAALREGGADKMIRTYARYGYRFCDPGGDGMNDSNDCARAVDPLLSKARRAFMAQEWEAALSAYRDADRQRAVDAEDLERWAEAARWAGYPGEAVMPLERAVTAYRMGGDDVGAARAVLSLAQLQFEARNFAVARGWHRQAGRFLANREEGREFALLQWMGCRLALVDGDIELAARLAEQTRELGHRLGDMDIELLGLMYSGHALLAKGDTGRGVARHDEAAAAVMAGGISPWAGGLVYCGVIWACRNRGDWYRAGQWTAHFTRWCERSGVRAFPGTCRLHRAEVLGMRGELEEAEREIASSCELLSRAAPWAEGDAYRVMGDLHLLRGELDKAESAYRRAHELGWDPQPGYARLLLALGREEAAYRSLERSLAARDWSSAQRRGLYLAHLAMIASIAGDCERARQALDTLESTPGLCATSAMMATAAQARGELALCRGERKLAVSALRQGASLWRDVGAPLQVALVGLRLAQCLLAEQDPEVADLELGSAEKLFRELRIPHLLKQCHELRETLVIDR